MISRNTLKPKAVKKLEGEIEKTKDGIVKEARRYQQLLRKESTVRGAYVVFRTMEGAARLITAYGTSRSSRCLAAWCCAGCVDKDEYRHKLFHKRWLRVEQAVEPSLINWENLGLTMCQRRVRWVIGVLFALALLLLATICITYVKVEQDSLSQDTPVCASDTAITRDMAYEDF